jgi:hypothetical protein
MMEVIFNYNELFCIRHSDAGDKAEPYMWFAFVFADVNTVVPAANRFVITVNMADQISCRHLFQQGAESGDVIPIPPSVGHHRILLDDTAAEMVAPVVIVVYAVLEENETTDSLMTLGHQVFGRAIEDEINHFVLKHLPPPIPSPTEEEKAAMAARVEERVFDAVEDAASWTEWFNTNDRLVGFAFEIFDWNALSAMRDGAPGQPFPIPRTIHKERRFPRPHFPDLILVDDYEVRGSVQVSRITPPDRCQDLRDGYNRVAEVFKDSEATLHRLREEFLKAPASRKPGIHKQIKEARAKKANALHAIARAHDDYRACRAEDPIRTKETT